MAAFTVDTICMLIDDLIRLEKDPILVITPQFVSDTTRKDLESIGYIIDDSHEKVWPYFITISDNKTP